MPPTDQVSEGDTHLIRNQEAIRRLFRVSRDLVGNLPTMPGIYSDSIAPVVRTGLDGERELILMRWGFPPPPNLGCAPVTNIRNTKSPYWRGWLKPGFRCLVPVTSFCEWTDSRPKVPHWFALGNDRPLFAFAGLWRPWTGVRGTKAAPVNGEHLLFAFLTTESNETVRPIHAKAMPVILTAPDEFDLWLAAPAEEALALQRPLAAEALKIVTKGKKEDADVTFQNHL